jgi:hypothetical protein
VSTPTIYDAEHFVKTTCIFTADAPFRQQHLIDLAGDIPDPALTKHLFCVLVLKNGYTVSGEYATPHYADFDAETGKAIAKTKALQKVQELLAFGMCDQQPETDSPTPRTPQEAPVERSEET